MDQAFQRHSRDILGRPSQTLRPGQIDLQDAAATVGLDIEMLCRLVGRRGQWRVRLGVVLALSCRGGDLRHRRLSLGRQK